MKRPTARSPNCRVQDRQLMARPKHLTWEEAASYTSLATAYRMLFGHEPHRLKPATTCSSGASGGLGVFGVQLARRPAQTPSASFR
jgi:crotonyl-CoA carboxylase/reductase